MSNFYDQFGKQRFQKLPTSVELTKELEDAIETFMHHINFENGLSEDCYRSEIYFWLKDMREKMPVEEYESLRDYYVFGGIYHNRPHDG